MANAGITFDFAAETAKLRSEIDKVRKDVGGLTSTVKGVEKGFKMIGGIVAGAFSVSAITGFLSKVNETMDSLNDLSGKMGVSASSLQTLQLAAALAGGSAEGVTTAMTKMSTTIGDAMAGNKQAADAFGKLGLSVQQLAALKPDEAFRLINQRLSELGNGYQQAAIAQDIYGKGARDITGLYKEGDSAIREVNQRLLEQGAAINDLDVAKIGVMNDDLQFQTAVVTNLGSKFLSGLSPAVGVATGSVAEMLSRLGGASEAGKLFGTIMVGAIKIIETEAYGLAAVFETVRAVIAGVLAVIADGIGSVVGGIASTAEFLGLKIAEPIRNAANVMGKIGTYLQNASDHARENAVQAASYAIEAAVNIVKAGEIFDTAQADYERKAQEAAARNAAERADAERKAAEAAGRTGVQATTSKVAGKPAYDPTAARMSTDTGDGTDRKEIAPELVKDPLTDPKYLYEQQLGAALGQLASDQALEQLNIAQVRDASILDSLFLRNDMMVAAEQAKNMTLGQMMGELVQMGLQQGGAMGKAAKAYAIAQTIWSTGQAVMKAMSSPQLPWPSNLAAAAMVAARGAMQLANIRKTNVGSGGSVAAPGGSMPSAASSTPTAAAPDTESQQKTAAQVVINGPIFSSTETAQWIIDQITEATSRDLVFISPTSRQAMEIRGSV